MINTLLAKTRFGDVEYSEQDVFTFDDGLIGFGDLRSFVLLSHKPESPFRWLQSIEESSVAFLMVDPDAYVEGYQPTISDALAMQLRLTPTTAHLVFVTACIPTGSASEMTLNLAAPIVLNLEARIGMQVVLEGDAYNIRHRVFPQANQEGKKAA